MAAFTKGIKTLISGPDTSAQDAQIAQAKDQQNIALARQQQTAQQSAAVQDQQAGLVSRNPRGRRLLQAATGTGGTQDTLG